MRQGRRVPAAGHHLRLGRRHLALRRAQAPLRQAARALADDRDRPRALHPLLPLRALLAGDLRRLPARAAGARRALLRLDLRRPPLRRALLRQHRRAVPRRRADLAPYRFSARPWDIEDAGSVCTLCPSQCNVTLTVRDERVAARARAREPRGRRRLAVRPRPLRLPAPWREERVTEPLLRDGGELRPVSWERALAEAAAALRARGAHGALVGGETTNEEGFLLARLMREGLGCPHIDSRRRARCRWSFTRRWPTRVCRPGLSDLEFAARRARARVRPDRGRADPRPAPAQGRPPPRHAALAGERRGPADCAATSGSWPPAAARSGRGGRDPLARAPDRRPRRRGRGPRRCSYAGGHAVLAASPGRAAGSTRGRKRPRPARGRGAAERRSRTVRAPASCRRGPRRRSRHRRRPGRRRAGGRAAVAGRPAESGRQSVEYERTSSDGGPPAPIPSCGSGRWSAHRPSSRMPRSSRDGLREHVNVVLPGAAYAEKEGTIVAPDGRLQRLRPAVAHPATPATHGRRSSTGSPRVGLDLAVLTVTDGLPSNCSTRCRIYEGLTLEEIGGKGIRWQDRSAVVATS